MLESCSDSLPRTHWLSVRSLSGVLLSVGMVLMLGTGCADDALTGVRAGSASESSNREEIPTDAGFPRTIRGPGGETIQLQYAPRRIIPVSASAVDYVLSLVGPDRVAAISEVSIPYSIVSSALSNWPEEKTFGQFTAEEIVSRNPDLVITHEWQSAQTVAVLRDAGLNVLVIPSLSDIEDSFEALKLLGRVLGVEELAAEKVSDLQARIESIRKRGRMAGTRVLTYTSFGTGGTCAGSGTAFDVMLRIAGLTNVAAERGITGFDSVDNEWLLAANPDWIVVGESVEAPGTSATAAYLEHTAALAELSAVKSGRIIRLPVDLYTTSSHLLVDSAERLLDELDAGGS